MWARCAAGHVHWGRRGAAGLLLRHQASDGARYLLQHRAPIVHHGDTWGIPGGAIEPGETAETAAWREAREELGLVKTDELTLADTHVDDHGGWSYSTIIVDSPSTFTVEGLNFETGHLGVRWFTAQEMTEQHLHPGFALSWPALSAL